MSAELAPLVRQRFADSSGVPLAGGSLYTYAAGTTTPQATYTDRTAVSANTNPVVLDANGEADVWIDASLYYKFVLKDSSGNTIWTKDQLSVPSTAALSSTPWRDVVYITFTDSPYSITSAHNGKLIDVDTTAGAVVINLPQISSLTLPFNIGVQYKAGANSVTINRAGTDTLSGATSKVLTVLGHTVQLVPDIDPAPDEWTVLNFGNVVDAGSILRSSLATGAVPIPNRVTKSGNYTATASDDEIYVTATCTITLPAVSTTGLRSIKVIVNATNITVTIARSGSDTILGETSQTLTGIYTSVKFVPDGTSNYTVE